MCGLVGMFSKKNRPVAQKVISLYKKQKSRGSDGYGYLAIRNDNTIVGVSRARNEKQICEMLQKEQAEVILFHHRFPTSTKNTLGTTHPIFVSHEELKYNYYLSHNGVITNKETLKKKHNELGYKYTTEFKEDVFAVYLDGTREHIDSNTSVFNDSESLAIEFARYVEGLSLKIESNGSVALWCIAVDKETNKAVKLYLAKNDGRDLKLVSDKKYWGFSSETGTDFESSKLFVVDMETRKVKDEDIDLPGGVKTVTHYGYHMNEHRQIKNPTQSVMNYNHLENKHYTYKDACDTGLPMSEFLGVSVNGVNLYVPSKFAGQMDTREPYIPLLPNGKKVEEDAKQIKDKVRMEELCIELVKKETERDELYDAFYAGQIEKEEYDDRGTRNDIQQQELQEKIYATGIEEEIIEETLQLARDMEYYNQTYSVTS